MHVPVEVQVWRLSALFLTGVGALVLFEAYRALRSVIRLRKAGFHLLDILVALGTVGGIGWVTYSINRGEVRLYVPVSLACGFATSKALVGSIIYQNARAAFLYTRGAIRWTARHAIEPPRRALQKTAKWLAEAFTADQGPEPPHDTQS